MDNGGSDNRGSTVLLSTHLTVLVLYIRKYFLLPAGVFVFIFKYQMWALLHNYLSTFKYTCDSTWQNLSTVLISAGHGVLDKIPQYLYFTEGSETKKFCLRDFKILRFQDFLKISRFP